MPADHKLLRVYNGSPRLCKKFPHFNDRPYFSRILCGVLQCYCPINYQVALPNWNFWYSRLICSVKRLLWCLLRLYLRLYPPKTNKRPHWKWLVVYLLRHHIGHYSRSISAPYICLSILNPQISTLSREGIISSKANRNHL